MGQEKTAGGEGQNNAHGHEPKGQCFVGCVTDQSDVGLRHLKSVGLSVTHLNYPGGGYADVAVEKVCAKADSHCLAQRIGEPEASLQARRVTPSATNEPLLLLREGGNQGGLTPHISKLTPSSFMNVHEHTKYGGPADFHQHCTFMNVHECSEHS
eukprot:275958-Rhodomonas_salina.1